MQNMKSNFRKEDKNSNAVIEDNDNTKKNQPSKWFETKYTAGGQRDIEFLRFFYNDKSHFKIAHEIEKKMIFLKNMETLFFKIDQIMNICFLNEKQDDLTFKAITLLISETNEKDLGSLKANVNNGKVEIFNTLNKILLHHDHIDIT